MLPSLVASWRPERKPDPRLAAKSHIALCRKWKPNFANQKTAATCKSRRTRLASGRPTRTDPAIGSPRQDLDCEWFECQAGPQIPRQMLSSKRAFRRDLLHRKEF